jgi:hypothetical protein
MERPWAWELQFVEDAFLLRVVKMKYVWVEAVQDNEIRTKAFIRASISTYPINV